MAVNRWVIDSVVFLCGAAVLVIELISARHLSPFYGTSLAVWTAVISVTLAALSVGYLAGGRLGDRMVQHNRGLLGLAWILAAASVSCGLLPVLGPPIMRGMLGLGLIGGVLASTTLMLLPALAALGMVGPYAIRLSTHDVQQAGRVAGRVFALSTIGSILAALATGLLLAPTIGVRGSYLLVAGALGLLAIIAFAGSLRSVTKTTAIAIGLALTLTPAARSTYRPTPVTLGEYTILEIDEGGPYGEIKIAERRSSLGKQRLVLFDGLCQSGIYAETGASVFPYANVIAAGLSALPDDSRVVVVGTGGGILSTLLHRMGYQVITVDIDDRMIHAARTWFGMPEEIEVVLGDGRQYLQNLKPQSIDAIVLDVFTGDREPVHMMTLECFAACRRALKPQGLLVLNPLMYTNVPRGECYAGLIQTLQQAGFKPQAVGTTAEEEYRNILVFAQADRRPWNKGFRRAPLLKLGVELGGIVLRDFYLALLNPVEPVPTAQPLIFTDDRTSLDYLNQSWNHGLRREMIREVTPEVIFY